MNVNHIRGDMRDMNRTHSSDLYVGAIKILLHYFYVCIYIYKFIECILFM